MLAGANLELVPLTDDVQFPLKQLARRFFSAADERLTDDRLDVACGPANWLIINRHVTPAQEPLPFVGANRFQSLFAVSPFNWIDRQEDIADAVISWPW